MTSPLIYFFTLFKQNILNNFQLLYLNPHDCSFNRIFVSISLVKSNCSWNPSISVPETFREMLPEELWEVFLNYFQKFSFRCSLTKPSPSHFPRHSPGTHKALPEPFTLLHSQLFYASLCRSYIPTSAWIYIV